MREVQEGSEAGRHGAVGDEEVSEGYGGERLRESEFELEQARWQAARMEAAQRREAEACILQLQNALATARAMEYQEEREYLLARDDPEQYRQLIQARIDADNAQQQAIQSLAQTAARVLREQQGRLASGSGGTPGFIAEF